MKNPTLLFLVLAMLLCRFSFAQNSQPVASCKYDQLQNNFQATEPQNYALFMQARQTALQQVETERQQRSTGPTDGCPDGIRIIPLYFHILHSNGNPNLPGDNNFTVAEISSAVDNLNKYYAGNNYNLERVPDEFWEKNSVSTNTCIQFCWNTSDVNRVNVAQAPFTTTMFNANGYIRDGQDLLASPLQNKCKYVNIYVGNYGMGINGSGLLGYAHNLFSAEAHIAIEDNVFIPNGPLTNYIDTNSTSLPHELAHFFGLPHAWGPFNIDSATWVALNTSATVFCNVDDGVYDTPLSGRPCDGGGPGVPTLVQNEVVTHCSGVHVMWTNFMDYTRRDWRVNFTKGQANFMRYYISNAQTALTQAWFGCTSGANFLNGETYCSGLAIVCDVGPVTTFAETVSVCNADTINLLRYMQNWGYNNSKSPATEYSWRRGSLTGPLVNFPAKTPVYRYGTICKPDTTVYYLNMKCATSGAEETAGTVTVLAYGTPEALLKKYLRNGDCQNGPGPVYSAADLAAGCDQLVVFTPQTTPAFPTTISGKIVYTVTFSSSVLGPCCTSNCTRYDTGYYYCQVPVNSCPGVLVSGGLNAIELVPCPDLDFDALYDGYENNLVSIFDPQGNISGFFYYSDVLRTIDFDPLTDYYYDGNGCNNGSDILIYTALGCDTNHDGIPNTYITLGSIRLDDPSAPPQAPTLSYTVNGSQDCVYTVHKACSQDDVTPNPIPIAVCGSANLPAVTFSVLTDDGCEATFVVQKPDCPNCTVIGCATSNFTGGIESVCSGGTLNSGFPTVNITGSSGPTGGVFWTTETMANGFGTMFPGEPDDLPEWPGPDFFSTNPASGNPETQTLYAYTSCDDDNDPATAPVYTLLGQYVVTVNPAPNGNIIPVCHGNDSLNFYLEVALYTNNASNSFTATNSFNASTLTFTTPDVKELGPFPNGTNVSVDFGIDGGCSTQTETFNTGCLTSSCSNPEISFSKICLNNDPSQYYVDVIITGNTIGYLFEVTNSLNSDTDYISMQDPAVRLGAYPSANIVDVKVVDYTHKTCFTQSGALSGNCVFVSINNIENTIMKLYPNPTSGKLIIENAKEEIRIFDLLGQEVLSRRIIADKTEVDVSSFASGIYFVKSGNGAKKFIKE